MSILSTAFGIGNHDITEPGSGGTWYFKFVTNPPTPDQPYVEVTVTLGQGPSLPPIRLTEPGITGQRKFDPNPTVVQDSQIKGSLTWTQGTKEHPLSLVTFQGFCQQNQRATLDLTEQETVVAAWKET